MGGTHLWEGAEPEEGALLAAAMATVALSELTLGWREGELSTANWLSICATLESSWPRVDRTTYNTGRESCIRVYKFETRASQITVQTSAETL